jgi:hypothetical protein
MRELEFDKINAVLDRAQFAIQQIQRTVDELARKKAAARTPQEIAAVDLMADERLAMPFAPAIRLLISDWSPIQSKEQSW